LWCRDGEPGWTIIGIAATTVVATSVPFLPIEARAQAEVRIDADASGYYAENPFLLSGGNTAAGAIGVAVRPTVVLPIAPATTLELDSEVRLRRYHRRYGEFVTGRTEATLRHRSDEHLSLLGSLGYTRELPIDAITEDIGAALDARSVRNSFLGRGSANWHPTQHTLIQGEASAQRTRYSSSSDLRSSTAYDFALSGSRELSARTSVGVRAGLALSSISGETISARTVQVTATQRISATVRADLRAGVEWSQSGLAEEDALPSRARLSGTASVCDERRRFNFCATASMRSQFNGLNGLQRELSAGLSSAWRLSEKGTLNLDAQYRKSPSSAQFGSLNVLDASASYDHRLSQRFVLSAGVDYLRRGRPDSSSVSAAIVHVTFTFKEAG
jgi:hypothetical protein